MADINKRKLEHINIVLKKDVEPSESPFAKYKLPYKALPEIDLAEVDTSTTFLGKKVSFPFLIASMTGGPDKGKYINKHLALAAEKMQIPLALGSMRVILRNPEALKTFAVRKYCPTIPLFANMGIVQLNYGYGAKEINHLIQSIEADGIFLHVNPLQEAIQPEGDTNFKNLIPKLAKILPKIKGKVIIKEVGTGIDSLSAKQLRDIGIEWIDVSGTGGTSWAWIEGYRRNDKLGELFRSEGVVADTAIQDAARIKGLNVIAGAGIRTGIDIAKAIALGGKMTSAAKPLLQPALTSATACEQLLTSLRQELRIAMFISGVKNITELQKIKLGSS